MKNNTGLRDGLQLLNLYESELTPAAVAQVQEAARVRDYQAAQLRETGALEAETEQAVQRIEDQLASDPAHGGRSQAWKRT